LNVGTTFFIYFNIITDIDGQICLDNAASTVFYNVKINALGVIWKSQATSEQYRQVFIKSLEMMMMYHSTYWISDMRKQGEVQMDDQKWMIKEIFPAAVQQGLKKGVCIYDPEQHNKDYRERLRQTSLVLGVETFFFESYQSAEEWIEQQEEANRPNVQN
jgi:hypothetical protein